MRKENSSKSKTKTYDCYLPLAIEINKILCYPTEPHLHILGCTHQWNGDVYGNRINSDDFRQRMPHIKENLSFSLLTSGNDSSSGQCLILFYLVLVKFERSMIRCFYFCSVHTHVHQKTCNEQRNRNDNNFSIVRLFPLLRKELNFGFGWMALNQINE